MQNVENCSIGNDDNDFFIIKTMKKLYSCSVSPLFWLAGFLCASYCSLGLIMSRGNTMRISCGEQWKKVERRKYYYILGIIFYWEYTNDCAAFQLYCWVVLAGETSSQWSGYAGLLIKMKIFIPNVTEPTKLYRALWTMKWRIHFHSISLY